MRKFQLWLPSIKRQGMKPFIKESIPGLQTQGPPSLFNYGEPIALIEAKELIVAIDLLSDLYEVMPKALNGHQDLIQRTKQILGQAFEL